MSTSLIDDRGNYDALALRQALKAKDETYWRDRGERATMQMFHQVAERVPAYREFLRIRSVDHKKIQTIQDFRAYVPLTDKDNYLRQFKRHELCWDGTFSDKSWVISATSGSTGDPFYFPRTSKQDDYYALSAELYLIENFSIHERKTLYIDAFALGIWIGGIFTYEAIKKVAGKGYSLSIATPGINKQEVVNTVKNLGESFEQVIIGCYPPVLKDIIDLGISQGIDWGAYNLGVVFSAEGFSEGFRDYVIKSAKLKNPFSSTLNHYGTVDLGTMAHETPASIMIRRDASNNPGMWRSLFGKSTKTPTLAQYLPELFYFESVEDSLICTSEGGFPLVRYDLKDFGGVLSLSEVASSYKKHTMDFADNLEKNGISETLWNLPFVYLYERKDFSVTFSGAQIYPEEIRKALLDPDLQSSVTGKFTMTSDYDELVQNQLTINVELMINKVPSEALAKSVGDKIVEVLIRENSEYRVLYSSDPEKLRPVITLWENSDPKYFGSGGKQKWVIK